jgi:hypothetical protein
MSAAARLILLIHRVSSVDTRALLNGLLQIVVVVVIIVEWSRRFMALAFWQTPKLATFAHSPAVDLPGVGNGERVARTARDADDLIGLQGGNVRWSSAGGLRLSSSSIRSKLAPVVFPPRVHSAAREEGEHVPIAARDGGNRRPEKLSNDARRPCEAT